MVVGFAFTFWTLRHRVAQTPSQNRAILIGNLNMQPTSYPACSAFSRWVIAAVGVLAMGAVLSRTGLAVHATQGLVSGVFLAFGFFTIWTNTAVAAICFWVATRRRWSPLSCGLMTGATAMILFVGLVYHFLLHGSVRFGSVAGLTETALHYIVPAAMMLVWR